jgi:hypothetical protein
VTNLYSQSEKFEKFFIHYKYVGIFQKISISEGYKKIEAKATKLFVKYCTHMFWNAFFKGKVFSP